MANPNPVKQTRKPVDSMSPRMQAKLGTYKPRDRVDGEALPRVINTQAKGNIYKPAQHLNARSGLAICG